MGRTVYPTGVTLYDKEQCYNGYTLYRTTTGAVLIDMNGNLVHFWDGLKGFPHKLLPGGYCIGNMEERARRNSYQDSIDLTQVDWDGNIVWQFKNNELIQEIDEEPKWMCRQHHDFQREGSTVGYYYPGGEPKVNEGNTLILTHTNTRNRQISDKLLIDEKVIEVDWEGNIVWQWIASDHYDEYGFSGDAKNAISAHPSIQHFKEFEDAGDWIHINSMSTLGPNKWFDAGDERFAPENIIMDGREANVMFIISKETGKVVWRLGPDFTASEELKKIGQIIGQHHCHMIPKGLPGEGNILIFDNGGFAGYGAATPGSPDGEMVARRHYSRVIEINPVTLEVVWEYPKRKPNDVMGNAAYREFFSPLVSSAQRLPNGNTMIAEGSMGRLFEVTENLEIVWEYIIPYKVVGRDGNVMPQASTYRAYRYPYDWVPQVEKPVEKSVTPPDNREFFVPGSEADIDLARSTVKVEYK